MRSDLLMLEPWMEPWGGELRRVLGAAGSYPDARRHTLTEIRVEVDVDAIFLCELNREGIGLVTV